MSDTGSKSFSSLPDWLNAMRDGQNEAVERLWSMYFERMVLVARRKLSSSQRCVRDEEDIALSAFKSFCLGFQRGRFNVDSQPDNLWPLLVSLTINKAINHLRYLGREKRGGNAKQSPNSASDQEDHWQSLLSREPSPDMQAAMLDALESLLTKLDETEDSSLRTIALLAIDGHSASQIATSLGDCSNRTVQRKLKTIRSLWESEPHESA